MKHFIFIACIFCSISCTKESLTSETSELDMLNSAENFLHFDIKDIQYDAQFTNEYSLEFTQVEGQPFELLAINEIDRYLWFMPWSIMEDSVTVIAKVSFTLDTEIETPFNDLDMEFTFIEAKDKLTQLTDSTYKYKSIADFHTFSKNTSWGEAYNGNAFEMNNIMLTVPEPVAVSANYSHYISTNGFYFDDETIQSSTGQFNVEEQSFEISGGFKVKVKQLSCGFYMTHDIRKARFQVKIQ